MMWGADLPIKRSLYPWWRHQKETFPTLLALCFGNSPVTMLGSKLIDVDKRGPCAYTVAWFLRRTVLHAVKSYFFIPLPNCHSHYLQFRTLVECVTPELSEAGVQWDVKVRHLNDNKVTQIKASAVMVCNGWVLSRLWDKNIDLVYILKSTGPEFWERISNHINIKLWEVITDDLFSTPV